MRTDETGTLARERDTEAGWEVALPRGGTPYDGVRMAGFRDLRDRSAAGLTMRPLPQPAVVVIVGLGEVPFSVGGGTGCRALTSFVAPLSPGSVRISGERIECVELRLSPRAAYALLGASPRELNGAVTGLDDLWGPRARRLGERLSAAPTWQQRFALMDEFLRRRGAAAPAMAPEVAAVWEHIVARRGQVRVGRLAEACGWSRKRLWSRFTAQIGVTPKRAAMLVRFDHAARALSAGASPADVALNCGYVDQSHLGRDVLTLAGCTPSTLARETTTAG